MMDHQLLATVQQLAAQQLMNENMEIWGRKAKIYFLLKSHSTAAKVKITIQVTSKEAAWGENSQWTQNRYFIQKQRHFQHEF